MESVLTWALTARQLCEFITPLGACSSLQGSRSCATVTSARSLVQDTCCFARETGGDERSSAALVLSNDKSERKLLKGKELASDLDSLENVF